MSTPLPPAPAPALTEVYGTLTGMVDAEMVKRVFAAGQAAVNGGVRKLHLLIQSTGGGVGDGIEIYNYLRRLPFELSTYNGGTVSSIAVLVYLAGTRRLVSSAAAFMIHKSTTSWNAAVTVEQLEIAASGLRIDDARSEGILREHLRLPPKRWEMHERGDVTLTAQESVEFGLAHEIGDFAPPVGSKLFTI